MHRTIWVCNKSFLKYFGCLYLGWIGGHMKCSMRREVAPLSLGWVPQREDDVPGTRRYLKENGLWFAWLLILLSRMFKCCVYKSRCYEPWYWSLLLLLFLLLLLLSLICYLIQLRHLPCSGDSLMFCLRHYYVDEHDASGLHLQV